MSMGSILIILTGDDVTVLCIDISDVFSAVGDYFCAVQECADFSWHRNL